jgi:hypothetical protein
MILIDNLVVDISRESGLLIINYLIDIVGNYILKLSLKKCDIFQL